MSNTDSFIEEVTEEVRRDRLFALARRYGWIGIVLILAVVGGTAWQAWSRGAQEAQAQQFGDALIAALDGQSPEERVAALEAIAVQAHGAQAVRAQVLATAQLEADAPGEAAESLARVAQLSELPAIYRQVAEFKRLTLADGVLADPERRAGLEQMATPGHPLRLLAEEQIALIDIKDGATEAAIARLEAVIVDSEVSRSVQERALQLLVALGAEPDLPGLTGGQ